MDVKVPTASRTDVDTRRIAAPGSELDSQGLDCPGLDCRERMIILATLAVLWLNMVLKLA